MILISLVLSFLFADPNMDNQVGNIETMGKTNGLDCCVVEGASSIELLEQLQQKNESQDTDQDGRL